MTANATTAASTIRVHDPADGSIVAEVPDNPPADVAAAISQIRATQPAWEALGPGGRASWLLRYGNWLRAHQTELSALLQSETGKPWQEATFEIPLALDALGYCARNAAHFLADEHPKPHGILTAAKKLTVTRRPYPVVGVICPWNFPLLITLVDALPALTAGAAVAVKPSELTPLATQRAIEGWREIGAPDVLACVTGAAATGAALVDEVDFVQFTGSTATGRAVAGRAAQRLIPCSLELGGKDAAIVLADADLDRAVNGVVWGSLFNSGQACVAIERVYVEAPIHDEFARRVAKKVAALRQGKDGQDYHADVGALASAAQLRIVEGQVRDAVAKGARILTGGRRTREGGTFFEPTVLIDVDHSMNIMREETFGPTIPIMRVADADEAIRLANQSPYGLSATVWTRDRARGRRIARAIEAGSVNINDTFTNLFTFGVPHSGWKQSGLGARLGGPNCMQKYCRTQAITETRIAPKSEPLWYPYTARKGRLVSAILGIARVVDRR
ncbi:MAG: aldehyde dehydrogenase family protein, partial [Mycobacterium sp.]|nr:aldehyde dehydrogenase family protein [Mycobacterium sp.]